MWILQNYKNNFLIIFYSNITYNYFIQIDIQSFFNNNNKFMIISSYNMRMIYIISILSYTKLLYNINNNIKKLIYSVNNNINKILYNVNNNIIKSLVNLLFVF